MFADNVYNPSRHILNAIRRHTGENYIFWPMGSGSEMIVFFAFLQIFSEIKNTQFTLCILKGENIPLLKLFPYLEKKTLVLEVSHSNQITAFNQNLLPLSCFLLNSDRPAQGKIFFTSANTYTDGRHAQRWRHSGRRELSHVNLVRHILGLPTTVEPVPIEIGPVSTIPNLVFFAPMSNSFNVNYHSFLLMAAKCRNAGMRIVWNFTELEYGKLDLQFKQEIATDLLFKSSLPEALRMAKMSKIVVSARSSFCELLALSGCRYGIVYGSQQTKEERDYWNLDTFRTKPLFEITDDKTNDIFRVLSST